MENSLELTLEQTIELAEYYDVETEGRTMVAIEADIKKGISTVKNGFVKIFQVIIGWCRAIKLKLTKIKAVPVNPSLYNCGQRVIAKCKDLEKVGKKMAETGEPNDKEQSLTKAVDNLMDEFNKIKEEAKAPGKVARVAVNPSKIDKDIEELLKSAKAAQDEINKGYREVSGEDNAAANPTKNAGFKAIVKSCNTRMTVLKSYKLNTNSSESTNDKK